MSTVGSKALKGSDDCRVSDAAEDVACANTVEGCKMSKSGVALYAVNCVKREENLSKRERAEEDERPDVLVHAVQCVVP